MKLCQYADDCTLFTCNEESLSNALTLIDQFSKYGLKLNLDKYEILILGCGNLEVDSICGISCKRIIKCLGIYVGYDYDQCLQKNWNEKIENIETCLNQWKRRELTIFGKVTIIKSLIIPKYYTRR